MQALSSRLQRVTGQVGRQLHPADGGPCGRSGVRPRQMAGQRLANLLQCRRLVRHPGKGLRNGIDGVHPFGRRCALDDGAQRRGGFPRTVERQEDLQHETVGFPGLRHGLCPGSGRDQGRVARTALQGNLDGSTVEAGVTLAPGGIQDQRVGRARVSVPGIQFAQQQLVEQGCVQSGVAHPVGGGCGGFLGQRGRDSGSQCQHQGRQPQQGPCSGEVGLKARMALGGHRFIIMEGVCALCDPGQ